LHKNSRIEDWNPNGIWWIYRTLNISVFVDSHWFVCNQNLQSEKVPDQIFPNLQNSQHLQNLKNFKNQKNVQNFSKYTELEEFYKSTELDNFTTLIIFYKLHRFCYKKNCRFKSFKIYRICIVFQIYRIYQISQNLQNLLN
jgi:hypothetical protein